MHKLRIGHEPRPPARPVDAPADVEVLRVHECRLLQAAERVTGPAVDEHARADRGLDLTRGAVIPARADVRLPAVGDEAAQATSTNERDERWRERHDTLPHRQV